VRLDWGVYILGAAAATVGAVAEYAIGRRNYELGPFASAFQVSIGLLLTSVTAVTALAEERVRGSLDVLLATPLPTRAIVWGKWLGAFRFVPWLALLPVINVAAGMRSVEALLAVPLMIVLVLAYGAGVTSLGLACATWIRRFGRAVAVSVVVYALIAAGWFAIVLALARGMEDRGLLGTASPFYGPGLLTAEVEHTHHNWRFLAHPMLWTVLYVGAAGVLYWLVLGSFDRCLGRMPEGEPWRGRPPDDKTNLPGRRDPSGARGALSEY
jgi:ABC-type Na+ efflux pump permease subunit